MYDLLETLSTLSSLKDAVTGMTGNWASGYAYGLSLAIDAIRDRINEYDEIATTYGDNVVVLVIDNER